MGLFLGEKNILEGVFVLWDIQVWEVMVLCFGMVILLFMVCFVEMMEVVYYICYVCFLVIGQLLDDVCGVLDLCQMVELIVWGEFQVDLLFELYFQFVVFVLEICMLVELLLMICSGQLFLLVVDEYGGIEGLVIVVDFIGEIVGDEDFVEIDELDLFEEKDCFGVWLVVGDLEIFEFN